MAFGVTPGDMAIFHGTGQTEGAGSQAMKNKVTENLEQTGFHD